MWPTDFGVPAFHFARGGLLRSERSSFGAQYMVFCVPKNRVLERLRHCADTLLYIGTALYPLPAVKVGASHDACNTLNIGE